MSRADKQRVVEAQLFGSYQRRVDHDGLVDDEHRDRIDELEAKLRSMGGDPAEVLASVNRRRDDLLTMLRSEPEPTNKVSAQFDELIDRAADSV